MTTKTISLLAAVPLRSAIGKRIGELKAELERVSTLTIAKGEDGEPHDRSVEQVLADLDNAEADFRDLDFKVTNANVVNVIQWDSRQLSILDALNLNIQNRERIKLYQRLASRPKTERAASRGIMGGNSDLIVKTTYDPSRYRELAAKLTRQTALLSTHIDEKNAQARIQFDASEYLGAE